MQALDFWEGASRKQSLLFVFPKGDIMEENQFLKAYYEAYDEDNRLRSKHGMIEYLTTMRYIEKYLKPEMRIIEIGAGTGRYSHTLANMGNHVDPVELVEHNIKIFKSHITENEPVTVRQANALDLSEFSDNTYDITLLLGPMYHLYEKEDQQKSTVGSDPCYQKGRYYLYSILYGRCFDLKLRLRARRDTQYHRKMYAGPNHI